MDLRLDVVGEPGRAVIHVQGRLAGEAVCELERICGGASGPLVLDVTHLMSADEAGITALKRLVADGARFVGLSPYLALLLGREAS